MNENLQSSDAVVTSVKKRLASAATTGPAEALDAVVQELFQSGRFAWSAIYLAVEGKGICEARSGPAPARATIDDLKSEIAASIKVNGRTAGLLIAQTRAKHASRQDRELLHHTTKLIARYLNAHRAASVSRKTQANIQQKPALTHDRKGPQSARPATRKTASGEHFPR